MNEPQSGGKLIGEGSFGCVFYPALNCSNKKISGDKVSKIFFGPESKKESNEELKNDDLIKSIKGHEKWSHIWDMSCLPNKYENILKKDKGISVCLDENNIDEDEFNKNRRMLVGSYAGNSLYFEFENTFTKTIFTKKTQFTNKFLFFMRNFKPLLVGLDDMNKGKISHNDIKADNIMLNGEGFKYIDFGLSAKHSNIKFYKYRSMSEYASDRIYQPYPYEFILMFATKELLEVEKSEIEYDIYREFHDTYKLVHETIFNRSKIKEYLIELMDRCIENKYSTKDRHNIISLVDTYSVGFLIPVLLIKYAKKFNKMKELKKLINIKEIKPFIELFKDMCEPDYFNRISPSEALRRFNELEKLYLDNNTKQCKNPEKRTKRIRRA